MSERRKRNNDISNNREMELNKSQIGQSGNSDVDVKVKVMVDTTAIAYAYLCSMLATNKMTNEEFEDALEKLMELTSGTKKSSHKNKKLQNVENIENYREKIRKRSIR